MLKIIPTKKQWKKWSMPSKLTAIGTLVGVLSFSTYTLEKIFSQVSQTDAQRTNLVLENYNADNHSNDLLASNRGVSSEEEIEWYQDSRYYLYFDSLNPNIAINDVDFVADVTNDKFSILEKNRADSYQGDACMSFHLRGFPYIGNNSVGFTAQLDIALVFSWKNLKPTNLLRLLRSYEWRGGKKVTLNFWAKSSTSIDAEYATMGKEWERIVLGSSWKKFQRDVSDQDLTTGLSPFQLRFPRSWETEEITIKIDDVYFEAM